MEADKKNIKGFLLIIDEDIILSKDMIEIIICITDFSALLNH